MTLRKTHKHPCKFDEQGCKGVIECDGELSVNHDGEPRVICDVYHRRDGSVAEVPCETCEEASTVFEDEIVQCMAVNGGSFVQALARCYRAADDGNRQTLRDAFSDIWEEYEETAGMLKRRRTYALAG